jgi:hypothetical protein
MATLRRDASQAHKYLKELPDGQLFTTKACKIQIPEHFAHRGLAEVGIETYIYGIYALIFEDGIYAVSNINAMIKITPFKTQTVKIKEVLYYEFYFEANSVVIPNMNLVCRDTLIYNVFDEIYFKGKVPWYLNYEDIGKLFDTAKPHADSNVAENFETIELIASIVAREKGNRINYFRHSLKSAEDTKRSVPDYVPMMSVFYSATNTLNKLAGSYFNDGIVSALVNPSTEVQRIEQLLRT